MGNSNSTESHPTAASLIAECTAIAGPKPSSLNGWTYTLLQPLADAGTRHAAQGPQNLSFVWLHNENTFWVFYPLADAANRGALVEEFERAAREMKANEVQVVTTYKEEEWLVEFGYKKVVDQPTDQTKHLFHDPPKKVYQKSTA